MTRIREILKENGYTLLEQIGKGGYATCFKVLSHQYKQTFACKIINLEYNYKNDEKLNSFKAECEILQHLRHPHIINIYDYFSRDHYFFLILEYCPGGNIEQLIKREGSIPSAQLKPILSQLVSALNYCHCHNITHHDIKPANIFIEDEQRIKLADFGLSTINEVQESKQYFGSYAYAAPELYSTAPIDPYKTDVWALGITVYQMATGVMPFIAQTPQEMYHLITENKYVMPNDLDPVIAKVIQGALTPDPDKRPSMRDIGDILRTDEEKTTSTCSNLRRIHRVGRALTTSTAKLLIGGSFSHIQPPKRNKLMNRSISVTKQSSILTEV